MGTKVRILSAVHLAGRVYVPDQVVDLPATIANSLADQGQVDPHKDAVAYCTKVLGAEVIVHASVPTSAAIAERLAAIADCESRLAAASKADKPGIKDELAALTAE